MSDWIDFNGTFEEGFYQRIFKPGVLLLVQEYKEEGDCYYVEEYLIGHCDRWGDAGGKWPLLMESDQYAIIGYTIIWTPKD